MAFDSGENQALAQHSFLERLQTALDALPLSGTLRYAVAFSGGLDSTVLLDGMVRLAGARDVRALHVDHALHADSADWERHCSATAKALGVAYASRRVEVDQTGGGGVEAHAREARYAALAAMMRAGEVLLTAHHADDQLETLLLRIMRGAGVRGLRAVAGFAELGAGYVARPLLGFTRAELEAEARRQGLEWLEDPANADLRFDRNYLRSEVLPRLTSRWPAAPRLAWRLAARMADAESVLEAMAEQDAAGIDDPLRVPRERILELSPARQRNLLRHLIRRAGMALPDERQLESLRAALDVERADAGTRVRWPGGEARMFRGCMYLLEPPASGEAYGKNDERLSNSGAETAHGPSQQIAGAGAGAGAGRRGDESRGAAATRVSADEPWYGAEGVVRLVRADDGAGLPESWARAGLEVRFRVGGERFRPAGAAHRRPLKDWLREAGIVPWMRGRVPLLYMGEEIAAVADLCLGAEAAAALPRESRWRVVWESHAPIH